MAKLEAELDAAGLLVTPERPQARAFTFADISKLRYLDCVIKVRAGTQQACKSISNMPCYSSRELFILPGFPQLWQGGICVAHHRAVTLRIGTLLHVLPSLPCPRHQVAL